MIHAEHNGPAPAARRPRRLVGIDIARFLAVAGMFTVHFGPPFVGGDAGARLVGAAQGHSTALFTFLAGVSLAMLSGRHHPPVGTDLRAARTRVGLRAGLLIVLGFLLAWATVPAGFLLTVIIPYYGLYFLLALPFLGMSARRTAVAAAVVGAAGPQLSFLLRAWITPDSVPGAVAYGAEALDPLHRSLGLGVSDLLVTGYYPAASYLALVLAGLCVGRLDLRSTRIRGWLLFAGVVLAGSAYPLGWWLQSLAGGPSGLLPEGTVPPHHPEDLLGSLPHSGTSFELAGSLGIVLILLVLCLVTADVFGRALRPLAVAGSMTLTLYTLHSLVLMWQIVVGGWPLHGVPPELAAMSADPGAYAPDTPRMPHFPSDGHAPVGFWAWLNTHLSGVALLLAVALANLWSRVVTGRGPLEWLVSETVRAATSRHANAPGTRRPGGPVVAAPTKERDETEPKAPSA